MMIFEEILRISVSCRRIIMIFRRWRERKMTCKILAEKEMILINLIDQPQLIAKPTNTQNFFTPS